MLVLMLVPFRLLLYRCLHDDNTLHGRYVWRQTFTRFENIGTFEQVRRFQTRPPISSSFFVL